MENRQDVRSQIAPEKFGPYAPMVNIIIDNMGHKHLDFGCGTGFLSNLLSQATENQITGYDANSSSIEVAERLKIKNNLAYTDSKEKLSPQSFDSVSMTFVYHEGKKEVIKEAFDLLKPNGKLIVFDYNIKGCNMKEFMDVFTSDSEKKEVQNMGWEEAFVKHTFIGLSDCQQAADELGFVTLKSEPLKDNPKYFVWVGQKNE